MRRRTSSGNMTEPYSCCLNVPRNLSATFQTNATLSSKPIGVIRSALHILWVGGQPNGRSLTASGPGYSPRQGRQGGRGSEGDRALLGRLLGGPTVSDSDHP